jgi:hypothetical protein
MVERDRNTMNTARTGQASTPGGIGQQQATQIKEQVQEKAADLKETVTAQATEKIDAQKETASGSLNTVAHAFRQTGEQLRDNDQEGIAQYVDRAAGQVEQFAGYLSKRDIGTIARDTEAFARREPVLFLGGAFAVGLLAARFLKSTGSASQGSTGTRGAWQNQDEWYGRGPSAVGTPPQLPAHVGQDRGSAALSGSAVRQTPPTAGSGTGPSTGGKGIASASPSGTLGGTRSAATGTTPGTQPSDDVIVGGPPLPSDVIVGGPPREPGREGRR